MQELPFVYYKGEQFYVGWLEEYPDYKTQGVSLEELRENLRDIYEDLEADQIPFARQRGILVLD